MKQSKGNYIGGQWRQGNGNDFISHNPANGEKLWSGSEAAANDVDDAVAAARSAAPGWAALSLAERTAFLQKFKQELEKETKTLAEAISQETGKPLWDSTSEVKAMIGKVDISIEAYQDRCKERTRQQGASVSVTRHKPHGVVAVFGPYNFPGHLPNGHIVPALLAGNVVVFKPSELTPHVGELTLELWSRCGLPSGVINLVQGARSTGQFLAQHKDIDGLFFTGSWNTGKALSEIFGPQPNKILALEMGGNNPLIFTSASDLKAAAYLTLQSAFLSAGQRCTCARRLIVQEGAQSTEFLQNLTNLIKSIIVGNYSDQPEPFMGPVISEQVADKIIAFQKGLLDNGGHLVVEARKLKPGSGFISPGFIDVTSVKNRNDDEVFGPFLQLIRVATFDEALEEANRTSYGLSAGIITSNKNEYDRFLNTINAGVVNWNTALTGASSAAPFGGLGKSGNHRPSAYYAADYCSVPVASLETEKLELPGALSPGITL